MLVWASVLQIDERRLCLCRRQQTLRGSGYARRPPRRWTDCLVVGAVVTDFGTQLVVLRAWHQVAVTGWSNLR